MYFAWFVSTWWHWLDILSITLLRWKTKRFAFAWSARWNALNQLLPSLSTRSQQSRDDSCVTGYHDYLTLKALLRPSVLQQLLPPHLALTSPLFLSLPSNTSSPPAIQMPFIQRREEKVEVAGFLKAPAPEELNSANKGGREGATSNRGYKKFIANGEALEVLKYLNCAL